MECSNILNFNISGKTILWIIIIIANLFALARAFIKYNISETFSNIYDDTIYLNFLKKLEYHSANLRNKIINNSTKTYLDINSKHPKNNQDVVQNFDRSYPIIPHKNHSINTNNNKRDSSNSIDRHHNILFGFIRNIFPKKHHHNHHNHVHHSIRHYNHKK